VIDDLITTGESKIETAEAFEAAGLVVKDFVVFIDRSLKAKEVLGSRGYRLHSLVNLEEILTTLLSHGKITAQQAEQARTFTRNLEAGNTDTRVKNPFADKLTELMYRKQTNLILSLDATNKADFFRILEATASEIAMVKVHVDILEDFDPTFPSASPPWQRRKISTSCQIESSPISGTLPACSTVAGSTGSPIGPTR